MSIGGSIPPPSQSIATSAALRAGLTSALRNGAHVKTANDPDGDGDNDHGRIEHGGEASSLTGAGAFGATSGSGAPASAGRGQLVNTSA